MRMSGSRESRFIKRTKRQHYDDGSSTYTLPIRSTVDYAPPSEFSSNNDRIHSGFKEEKDSKAIYRLPPSGSGSSYPYPRNSIVRDSKPAPNISQYLPEELCKVYQTLGKKGGDLFPWQAECLETGSVLEGESIVYCAPTSAGKSLVAEILMLRRLALTGKPAMLVLPFVALCTEKAHQLEQLIRPLNKQIKRFYGTHSSRIILSDSTGILVCTIEKANLLINRMIEEDLVQSLGTVVVDELHMVDDRHRGYLLEILLTKLRFMGQNCSEMELQIVGMSATMPNGKQIAKWLDAALFVTQTRPVPLKQYLKIGAVIHDEQGTVIRRLEGTFGSRQDPDHVASLTKETIDAGHSVLIFCCSKKACENCAQHLSSLLTVPVLHKSTTGADRASIVLELKALTAGYHPVLAEVILKGVAFHHAGLSSEERSLVELAYKSGVVSVLTATSTLAAGVNLPARRVIFKEPYVGLSSNVLDPTKYRQMAGRAGRAGIDEVGEAFLLESKYVATEKLQRLIQADAQLVSSSLLHEQSGLTRLMLEAICSGAAKTGNDIKRLIQSTLLAQVQDSTQSLFSATKTSLKWLESQQLIFWEQAEESNNHTGRWISSPLGNAIVYSGMLPEECALVRKDLDKAMEQIVLSSDLHLTYLVTPYNIETHIDWSQFYFLFNSLSVTDTKIAELVGVSMVFVQGKYKGVECEDPNAERIARRFYAALILRDVISEVPLSEICSRFDVTSGTVESLQEKAHRYATMTSAFCASLGWVPLKAMIEEFQKRIYGGTRPEIVHLTEIPFVKSRRARALYRGGFPTVESLATAESKTKVAKALFPEQDPDPTPQALGIAGKIIRNARISIQRRLSRMEEETKTAAEIVGDETIIPSEASLECFGHELDSLSNRSPSPGKPEVSNDVELSSNLRRLSLQITPFHSAEGIVFVRAEADLKSLEEFLTTLNSRLIGIAFDQDGMAITWCEDLVVYISLSLTEIGSSQEQSFLSLIQHESFQKGIFHQAQSIHWIPELLYTTLLDIKTAGKLLGAGSIALESLFEFCKYLDFEEEYNKTQNWIISASQQSSLESQVSSVCLEAALSRLILRFLRQSLEEKKLWELYIKMESPAALIMQSIEEEGILMDRSVLEGYLSTIHVRLEELEVAAEVLGGDKELNSASSKEIRQKLEQTMGLTLFNWVDEDLASNEILLRSLQDDHPLPAVILEYNKLRKQKQDLNSALQSNSADKIKLSRSGMFEMRYMQTSPNSLQAIPIQQVAFSHGYVWMSSRSPLDLDLINSVVPKDNYMLIVGELVDLDLSLLSELSQSKEISDVVRQGFDLDPFSALSASWLRGSISATDCVTEGEVCFCRKFINGFLEGISPLLCARQLRIGEKRSKETSKHLLERFKEVQNWIERLKDEVERTGGVRTVFRRFLPVSRTSDPLQTTRLAIRSAIQGSISDILKLATIYATQQIQIRLKTRARLLLQDDFYVALEVHKTDLDEGIKVLKESLDRASEMTVPVLIELHFGQSWSELKKWNHQYFNL